MKTNFKNIKRAARRGHFFSTPSAFKGMVRLNVRNANGQWVPNELMDERWANHLMVAPLLKMLGSKRKKHAHA
jgi:hypothetical protein